MFRAATVCLGIFWSTVGCRPSMPTEPPPDAIYAPEASFAERAEVSDSVRASCKVQSNLPRYVQRYTGGQVWFDPAIDPSVGRRLELTVTQISAPGAPPMVPRSMTIRARLLQDGEPLASFEAHRVTSMSHAGPPPRGFTGNCDLLRRVSAALGKDVARWLEEVEIPPP